MTRLEETTEVEEPTTDQEPPAPADIPHNATGAADNEQAVIRADAGEQVEGRKERWPRVSWMYSLTLPIAIWLALVSALVSAMSSTEMVTFTVIDQATSAPVEHAEVIVANLVYRTDGNGEVRIERPKTNESIVVRADGYVTVTGEWTNLAGDHQDVSIRPADSNSARSFTPEQIT